MLPSIEDSVLCVRDKVTQETYLCFRRAPICEFLGALELPRIHVWPKSECVDDCIRKLVTLLGLWGHKLVRICSEISNRLLHDNIE